MYGIQPVVYFYAGTVNSFCMVCKLLQKLSGYDTIAVMFRIFLNIIHSVL